MYFNGFIASSARIHKIKEHADDVNKFLGGLKCASLLAMLKILLLQANKMSMFLPRL